MESVYHRRVLSPHAFIVQVCILLLLVGTSGSWGTLQGQLLKVGIHGTLHTQHNLFLGAAPIPGRNSVPKYRGRLGGQFRIVVGKKIIPFSFSYGLPTRSWVIDRPQVPDLPRFPNLQNPTNRMTLDLPVLGGHLKVGSFRPREPSMISAGIVPLTGVQLDGFGSKGGYSFGWGRSYVAQQPDSVKGTKGRFAQQVFHLRMRTGRKTKSYSAINFIHAFDEPGSLPNQDWLRPRRSQGLSLEHRLKLGPLYEKGEVGVVLNSHNSRANLLTWTETDWLNQAFPVDTFTRPDVMGKWEGGIKTRNFQLGLNLLFQGPESGLISSPFKATDRAEAKIKLRMLLATWKKKKGQIRLEGSVGLQKNNLPLLYALDSPGRSKNESIQRGLFRGRLSYRDSLGNSWAVMYSNQQHQSYNLRDDMLIAQQVNQLATLSWQKRWDHHMFSFNGQWTKSLEYNFSQNRILPVEILGGSAHHILSMVGDKFQWTSDLSYNLVDDLAQTTLQSGPQITLKKMNWGAKGSFDRFAYPDIAIASGVRRVNQLGILGQFSWKPGNRLSFTFNQQMRFRDQNGWSMASLISAFYRI